MPKTLLLLQGLCLSYLQEQLIMSTIPGFLSTERLMYSLLGESLNLEQSKRLQEQEL
jgi:hypothetical protein